MEQGAISAAIIFGAIISLITLIVARGSKISELRQVWINDQRADFAAFGAAALSLAGQRSKDRATDFDKLETAAYRIRLRENPRQREWEPVIVKMDDIRRTLLANESTKIDVLTTLIAIGDLTQLRLKDDWNKVRFGEPGYRWLPALLAILVGAFVWLVHPVFLERQEGSAKPVEQHISGSLQISTGPVIRPKGEVVGTLPQAPQSSSTQRN